MDHQSPVLSLQRGTAPARGLQQKGRNPPCAGMGYTEIQPLRGIFAVQPAPSVRLFKPPLTNTADLHLLVNKGHKGFGKKKISPNYAKSSDLSSFSTPSFYNPFSIELMILKHRELQAREWNKHVAYFNAKNNQTGPANCLRRTSQETPPPARPPRAPFDLQQNGGEHQGLQLLCPGGRAFPEVLQQAGTRLERKRRRRQSVGLGGSAPSFARTRHIVHGALKRCVREVVVSHARAPRRLLQLVAQITADLPEQMEA